MKRIDQLFKAKDLMAIQRAQAAFQSTTMDGEDCTLSEYLSLLTDRAEACKILGKPIDPQIYISQLLLASHLPTRLLLTNCR